MSDAPNPAPNGSNGGSSLPEITVKALILGAVLSVVLAGANAYLGLKVGMTVSASIPAAVISMGVLSLFRRHNILENNIVQTAASAGESLAAGVIFTIPALVMIGYWSDFDYLEVTVVAGLGGVLGVLFTIPLRRALIVPGDLKFPEGVATAEVLKVGERGAGGMRFIVLSGIAGALVKFGQQGLGLWTSTVEYARRIGGSVGYVGSDLSPALLSVGYIVRLNIAVLVFIGGTISWFIAIPIYMAIHSADYAQLEAADAAWTIWNTKIRYLGVGAMVVGGLWALISLRKPLIDGIKSGFQSVKAARAGGETRDRRDRDIPMNWVAGALVASVVPLFLLYWYITGSISISAPMALVMLVAGFLFSAVAGYMAGLVGSSNNPVSGVTIATILFASLLLLWLMGSEAGTAGAAAAIFIGGTVCCAAAIAGDNMQDLKTGFIVGATPWKQQIMQIVGVLAAAVVLAPVLQLLLDAYGFVGASTAEQTDPLTAPQAGLMASVADGVFSKNLPWAFIGGGAIIAVIVIAVDKLLEARKVAWRAPVLAVAVGIYLPYELSVPILLGGLIGHFADRVSGKDEESGRLGLLVASGLITGEALVGILMAIPIAATGNKNVLAVVDSPIGAWPGMVAMALIGLGLWRVASRKR